MTSAYEVGAEHVYVVFYTADVGVEEVTYHSGDDRGQKEMREKDPPTHAMAIGSILANVAR